MDGMGVGRNPREISVGVDQRENDWVSSMYSSVEMEKKKLICKIVFKREKIKEIKDLERRKREAEEAVVDRVVE